MIEALLALFAIGLGLVIAGTHLKNKHARCTAQVTGVLRSKNDPIKSDSKPHYSYAYTVDGTEYVLYTGEGNSSPEAYDIGDACTIWYNPANPKQALAYHTDSNKGYTIMVFIGAAMVLAVVVLVVGFFTLLL